jgi:hypothetical protein
MAVLAHAALIVCCSLALWTPLELTFTMLCCSQGIIDWQLLLIQEFCDVGSLYDALQGRR